MGETVSHIYNPYDIRQRGIVKAQLEERIESDMQELAALDELETVSEEHRDLVVDPAVASVADALKRCVIGQVFIIALPNVEVSHLDRLEHANFIIYLNMDCS